MYYNVVTMALITICVTTDLKQITWLNYSTIQSNPVRRVDQKMTKNIVTENYKVI